MSACLREQCSKQSVLADLCLLLERAAAAVAGGGGAAAGQPTWVEECGSMLSAAHTQVAVGGLLSHCAGSPGRPAGGPACDQHICCSAQIRTC